MKNKKEYCLKTNGYQEIIRIFQKEGYSVILREQRREWVNKDSKYLDAKDCEVQLRGRCVAEISSGRLEKDFLVPSGKWILVVYNGIEGMIKKSCEFIENEKIKNNQGKK